VAERRCFGQGREDSKWGQQAVDYEGGGQNVGPEEKGQQDANSVEEQESSLQKRRIDALAENWDGGDGNDSGKISEAAQFISAM
jgi:hypothetical protein